MSQPVFNTAGIRAIEARHVDAAPPLMERAGSAVADMAIEMLKGAHGTPHEKHAGPPQVFLCPPVGGRGTRPQAAGQPKAGPAKRDAALPHKAASSGGILIVAGPGNNGGDGFVAARRLKARGLDPVVVFAGVPAGLTFDARAAFDAWRAEGGEVLPEIPAHTFALAIDALFGIGLARPLEGRHIHLVEAINGMGCPVLAVDIPSGLCADTGRIFGHAVRASRTLTFIALKPGLLTLDGPDRCGDVRVFDLGLDAGPSDGQLVSTELFRGCLRPRPKNSHKGSFGAAGILGGAPGMAGAALLTGRAALKLGAGRVHVGMIERLAVDPMQPELMLRKPGDVFDLATALAIGPGLGRSTEALELLRRAIDAPQPLVIDADGLNLLAEHPVLLKRLSRRESPTLLTPHPLEAARLLGTNAASVQADRVAAACTLARRIWPGKHAGPSQVFPGPLGGGRGTRPQAAGQPRAGPAKRDAALPHKAASSGGAYIALKGCGTVIAAPDGQWFINATGNPGLASAGSGDVLAGILVALLAQGWPAREALAGAVHLHGAAADALVARGIGPVGLAAGELIDAARALLNRWIAGI
ncbi:MAG: NAD(P)H-hydrate epimerase [Sulfuritalea sp.]|nr:NAD(P)H-hydrate epimerase [Sulfuritalea sp.]